MLQVECQEYLATVREFATKAGKLQGRNGLESQLEYLDGYAEHDERGKTRCRLFKDFAPMSFAFVMERKDADGSYQTWFNGGLIFHGSLDGYGSGSAPTFSVTLTPTDGWSVHT